MQKKYGGERRLQIKHLTALCNFRKVRVRNLEDMEECQVLLERVLIATQDSGPLHGQSLNLTAKEKLPEEDVQAYKYWLRDHSREDNFESLEEWVELRVQVIEEAKEETHDIGKKTGHVEQKKRFRGFNTRLTARCCIVPTCKEDHPPWVCKAFKDLSVLKRKELITKSGRCYCCLAAGFRSKDCTRERQCGVGRCLSKGHSSFLHVSPPKDKDSAERNL